MRKISKGIRNLGPAAEMKRQYIGSSHEAGKLASMNGYVSPSGPGTTRRGILRGVVMAAAAAALSRTAAWSQSAPPVRVEDFGGSARPGVDNTVPLRNALAEAARRRTGVLLGVGRYEFASTELLRSGAIRRPSGVALEGVGADRTEVRISGTSVINQLFDASDSSSVITRGIRFIGNGVKDENAPYAGGLMSAFLRPEAETDMSDIFLHDCVVDNFASATWLQFQNLSPRRTMRRVGSTGCRWISRPGTTPRAGEITVPGHFVYFYGYRGPIEDVLVDDPLMDAAHLKGGVGLVGNVDGGRIHVALLRDAGRALAGEPAGPDGAGAYAVLLYRRPSGAPHHLDVSLDRLEGVYSVGIYSAGAHSNRYRIGSANGQRDTRDGTLFKGILAIQGGHAIDAWIGQATDSLRVAMISIDGGENLGAAAARADIELELGSVESVPGARDITIDAGGSPRVGGVRIVGRRSGPAAVGVHLRAGPGVVLQDVDLSGLVSHGAHSPVEVGPGRVDLSRIALPL